jgi:hypothetical protein
MTIYAMNYYPLDLPFPVKQDKVAELYEKINSWISSLDGSAAYIYALEDYELFISDELKTIFNQLNVFPEAMLFFVDFSTRKSRQKNWIHSDIVNVNNEQWVKVPFALNFELTKSKVVFNWFENINDLKEVMPQTFEADLRSKWSSGIHYEYHGNGDTSQFASIDSYEMTSPALVRTNIPHNVSFEKVSQYRLGLSFRFPQNQLATIEAAAEVFSQHSV